MKSSCHCQFQILFIPNIQQLQSLVDIIRYPRKFFSVISGQLIRKHHTIPNNSYSSLNKCPYVENVNKSYINVDANHVLLLKSENEQFYICVPISSTPKISTSITQNQWKTMNSKPKTEFSRIWKLIRQTHLRMLSGWSMI